MEVADAIICILLILLFSKVVPSLMVHLHQSLVQRILLESVYMDLYVNCMY